MKKVWLVLVLVIVFTGCFSKKEERVDIIIIENQYYLKNVQIDDMIIGSNGDLKVEVKKGDHRIIWVEYSKNGYGEVYNEWYKSDIINVSKDNQVFEINYGGIYEITK